MTSWSRLIVATALVAAALAAVLFAPDERENGPKRYARSGSEYSFDVPRGFNLVFSRDASPPEGTPASEHRSADGIRIVAWWDGLHGRSAPVTRSTLPAAAARITDMIRAEEAETRNRFLEVRKDYWGYVRGPVGLMIAGRPALHFAIGRSSVSGADVRVVRERSHSYVVFKGRTPFRLVCAWAAGRIGETKVRSACAHVIRSLGLGTAPITG